MTLEPFSWRDRPALIEKLFPVQKLSVESFKEQMAVHGKTLTALGSYWKGRKPLILNKACVLGCLLPETNDLLKDLQIFEMLMAMDNGSLMNRLEEKSDKTSRDLLLRNKSATNSYQYNELVKAAFRPEECNEHVFTHIWGSVNQHLGTNAKNLPELINQMGIARFGRCPKVADLFCGSGQIPFEAARMGCDVYASDLNPIACMLTWGAFNIVGANKDKRHALDKSKKDLFAKVQKEIDKLEIETDDLGARAKVFLYCVEVKCPESGWMVPLLPSLIISKGYKVVAKLNPDPVKKRYDIGIHYVETDAEVTNAKDGTVQNGELVHSPDGRNTYRTKITTLRGDHTENYIKKNQLRMWEKLDFTPREKDIFQERLYCIQWYCSGKTESGLNYKFRPVTDKDLEREKKAIDYVQDNLADWQDKGWVPDMVIESGYNTDQPIRERGWTHWHHLFNPRQLILGAMLIKHGSSQNMFGLFQVLNNNCRASRWHNGGGGGGLVAGIFDNQALNTLYNYGCRSVKYADNFINQKYKQFPLSSNFKVLSHSAQELAEDNDIYITDPPYGDAVKYEEITEFFIAWLRNKPPQEFSSWIWDSRRALAIKGEDEDFRQGMIRAYKAMVDHMPDNGIQVMMFTHKSGSIWADMANIVWASGLQVTAAWYVVTEADIAIRKGANVTGTILLVLRKRAERLDTFRDDLAWEIKDHVKEQMDSLTGLDKSVREQNSEGLYNDADLQMAGYAAALKVLTTYSVIDGKDMEVEARAPRQKGVKGFVDEMIEFAIQNTVEYLVPSSFDKDDWKKLSAIERYYLKMIDMEAQGEKSLDNYQNFAKAFKIRRFEDLMGVSRANSSRLKVAAEFKSSLMSGDAEIAGSPLRALLYAMWETQKDIEMDEVLSHLMDNCGAHYLQSRHLLIAMAHHIADRREGLKPPKLYEAEASVARILSEAIQGHRL
jgi:putative DNA methylase